MVVIIFQIKLKGDLCLETKRRLDYAGPACSGSKWQPDQS